MEIIFARQVGLEQFLPSGGNHLPPTSRQYIRKYKDCVEKCGVSGKFGIADIFEVLDRVFLTIERVNRACCVGCVTFQNTTLGEEQRGYFKDGYE